MDRSCWIPIAVFTALLALQANNSGWAQDSDRSERYFNDLDRNRDGYLDSDEFRRVDGRLRDRFRDRGVDGERPVSKSRFMDTYRRIEEDRRKEEEERRREGGDSRSSSSSSSSRDRSSGSSRRSKVKLTAALPSKYAAFDKNLDDQIGMYEWDRAKYAEFIALDRNGDGFLTPNELDDPPKPNAPTVTATAPSGAAATSSSGTLATPGSSPAPATILKPASTDDPDTKQAKYMFSVIIDRDKNGEISEKEWADTRGIRPMFEKAGVTPTLPMKEADFVKQYLIVKQQPKK